MDLYAENIMHHYRNPLYQGNLSSPSVKHAEANLSCGDELTVELKVDDNRITGVAWHGTGCAISQAAMSMLCEELEGMPLTDVLSLSKQDVYDMLGVPVSTRRIKCALLCLHTVKNAVRAFQKESLQSWVDTVEIDE